MECFKCLKDCETCDDAVTCKQCRPNYSLSIDKKSCMPRADSGIAAPVDSQSSGISGGLLIVIVVVGVLLLVGLIIGVTVYCRRDSARKLRGTQAQTTSATLTLPNNTFQHPLSSNNITQAPHYTHRVNIGGVSITTNMSAWRNGRPVPL